MPRCSLWQWSTPLRRAKFRHVGLRSHRHPLRHAHSPADSPGFRSIVDNPPTLVRIKQKNSKVSLTIIALIPITAFCLGTWQVQRLDWKTKLIAKFEDRIIKPPLPLPPHIDPSVIPEFDYRRVYTRGTYLHSHEMLIGPRMHDGNDGYLVITPLQREGGSTVMVNRGWISKQMRDPKDRNAEALPKGEITVEGLLREPWRRNFFTPNNEVEKWKFHFPDVEEMARASGSEPVWIEQTMAPDLLQAYDKESKGIPIGRPGEVNLRNNHVQYIFTWYSLSAATTVMLWMLLRKKPVDVSRRVRRNVNW